MGQLDQFAKQILAEETESVTHGGAAWRLPPEISLSEVRIDGLLVVRDPSRLPGLAQPWPEAVGHEEVVIEIKMPGDHLGMAAVRRALLRRQAREVQRVEDQKAPWDGEEPLWMIAPHVPGELRRKRTLRPIAPGCFRIETGAFPFLWIAANELPLADELIPFLIARSGRPLDDFAQWVRSRRSPDWLLRMINILPMSAALRQNLLNALLKNINEPELRQQNEDIIRFLMTQTPAVRDEILEQGHMEEARAALRRVLARRKFVVSAEDESRIEACSDRATLERWLDQAVDAPSVADALR